MFIFDRFEALRAAKGISKSHIATAIGRTPTTIQDWKNGKAEPSKAQLAIVAELLNTTPEYLAGESDKSLPANEPADGLSRDELEIIQMFRSVQTPYQASAYNAIKSVLQALPSRDADEEDQ